jgi:hypothetical protein
MKDRAVKRGLIRTKGNARQKTQMHEKQLTPVSFMA